MAVVRLEPVTFGSLTQHHNHLTISAFYPQFLHNPWRPTDAFILVCFTFISTGVFFLSQIRSYLQYFISYTAIIEKYIKQKMTGQWEGHSVYVLPMCCYLQTGRLVDLLLRLSLLKLNTSYTKLRSVFPEVLSYILAVHLKFLKTSNMLFIAFL